MMPSFRSIALIALLAVGPHTAASAAGGPTVYRCGNAYQAEPCAGGSAVATDPAPSADQVAAAKDVAARDRQLGDALARDRAEREAQATPSQAIGIAATPNAGHGDKPSTRKSAKTSKKARKAGADSGDFVAFAPAKKKKAAPAAH
ncbi:MAG: hypothetical protein JSR59_26585 [Proteobacteria bacterium]|nr:hypothetical protein [Pseudomonadota bacterium]